MIAVIERGTGYTIADDGQLLGHLSGAKAKALRDALTEALKPVGTTVTPAKYAARKRPPIQVYRAGGRVNH